MAEQWRIFVVEDEQNLNRNMVSTLRKDGYFVQGVTSGADAVRALWSEDYDVVICDLKAGGNHAFELLEWLRVYRPNTRVVMVGFNSDEARTQALESGASSYLDKPLDLHMLKEELRRLLQQTGFSANLDSFDLLDVIQIINMSRKSIALLVNTGLEERGVLRFQDGELVWAEYGALRGDEAFFALAAHKNGTVLHQPWNGHIDSNVRQPLSRLILQALHYRSKYAPGQSESQELVTPESLPVAAQYDDSPFMVLEEAGNGVAQQTYGDAAYMQGEQGLQALNGSTPRYGAIEEEVLQPVQPKEWWQPTGRIPLVQSYTDTDHRQSQSSFEAAPTIAINMNEVFDGAGHASSPQKAAANERADLPSWLTEQPTSGIAAVRPSSRSDSAEIPLSPTTRAHPTPPVPHAEWKPPAESGPPLVRIIDRPIHPVTGDIPPLSSDTGARRAASAEWAPTEQMSQSRLNSVPLQSLSPSPAGPLAPPLAPPSQPFADPRTPVRETEGTRRTSGPLTGPTASSRSGRRNYNFVALASALQTLGYSIHGFVAAAVVSLDGQPIAQVSVDDLDISRQCKNFSSILKSVLQSLEQGDWGEHDHMIITSANRHILMRVAGIERNAFQVLITTRGADPVESLEVMTNIEGAISAALR